MDLRPIVPQKVYLQAMNQIRELIEAGHYKAGDKLPSERQLSEQLAISRPSVREALTALQALGLIRVKAGDGAFVEGPKDELTALLLSKEENPLDLLEARTVFEPSIVELAARKRTAEDLTRIQTILAEMASELAAGRHPVDGDREFHLAIARAAHNEILYRPMAGLVEQMGGMIWHRVKRLGLSGAELTAKYHDQHRHLCEAIELRDSRQAKRWMRIHLESVAIDLMDDVATPQLTIDVSSHQGSIAP